MSLDSVSSTISTPSGGGAMKGLGEKFSPDLHTGTGNFSVPIALPPGRNGFQPQIALSFSTGQGNDIFGLGWKLTVPGITRKTSDGVPHYNEQGKLPSHRRDDVFILSGSEDLVRISGTYPGEVHYQPRTEGLFAEIIHDTTSGNEWRVRTKDGMTSIYRPVICDPAISDPAKQKTFSWSLGETRDPFGNVITYEYESKQDSAGDKRKWAEHLLKAIRYADYEDHAGEKKFLLSVEFDYEKRTDKFSDYRSGFEIRVTHRCKSVRVLSHEQGGIERLVKKYGFTYEQAPHNGVSLLTSIEVTGNNDDPAVAASASEQPPPLVFGYTRLGLQSKQRRFFKVKIEGRSDVPLAHPDIDFVDLHGNGLPDILDTSSGWHYWRNIGGGCFDLRRRIDRAPPFRLSDPGVIVLDANGDGRPDLLATQGSPVGRFPLSHDMAWQPTSAQIFSRSPSFSLDDPEVRLLDLDGDGLPDVLRSGASFDCIFAERDGRDSWKNTTSVRRRQLAEFPNVSFTDSRVRIGDLSGDGLQDIAVIHEGVVEFWPNLGHGEWAALQTMAIEPRLPRGYDPRLLLFGDVDGDGLADLVLADEKGVRVWINQSGNRFVEYPMEITGTPVPNNTTTLRLIDLNGTGVSGLLWTQTPSGTSRPATLFLDFTTGVKPSLLNRMDNQMGAVTTVEYRSSSEYFLADFKRPSTRWRTPLPFPVQVVAKVTVTDEISQGKLTTEYRYHHGYWDGAEREFRGFGMVEQLDTEEIFDPAVKMREHYSPPIKTKTWFHQGPVGPEHGNWEELDYSHEYWSGDPQLLDHTGAVNAFLGSLPSRRAKRDALRTLRGSILRSELYALDDSPDRDRPYTVTEHTYALREELPPAANSDRLRIFFPHPVSQRTTQWERGDDPMTLFSFTGDYDPFGQPRQQTTVAAPRRAKHRHPVTAAVHGSVDLNESRFLAQHVRTKYASPTTSRILDRVSEVCSYECKAPPLANDTVADDAPSALRKQHQKALEILRDFSPLPLPGQPAATEPPSAFARLIGRQIHHYDGTAFNGLPADDVGDYGALVRTETLVLTAEILTDAYDGRRPKYLGGAADIPQHPDLSTIVPSDLGYREAPAGSTSFWIDSVRNEYDFHRGAVKARGLVLATQDPRGNVTQIEFDAHALLPVKVSDASGLETTATYNYRVLQPASVTDPNGTTTHLLYNAIGLPRKQYVVSSDGSQGGTEAKPELAYTYGFDQFISSRVPVFVATERRIHHALPVGASDETIRSYEFSDGFGRLVQTRSQAEDTLFGEKGDEVGLPGQAGAAVRDAVAVRLPDAVVVSGFQEYDQKGRVIRKFEPYFDSGFAYKQGIKPSGAVCVTLFYDPRGQVIRTVNPDGSEQRVLFGVPGSIAAPKLDDPGSFQPTPWESYVYDANDLAPLTHAASAVPVSHHYTPASTVLDGMGRSIAQIVRNGPAPATDWHLTRSSFDIRGNLLTITDALKRAAFRHSYDLLNRPLKVDSIDAGLRTSVLDASGNLIEYRDSKGSLVLRRYDVLNRLTELWAKDNKNAASRFTLREKLAYGPQGAPSLSAGRLVEHRDEAGIVKIHGYDFKGSVLETSRRVPKDSEMSGWLADWSSAESVATEAKLEAQGYVTSTTYDALNRVTSITYPEDVTRNRAVLTPVYNRGGALQSVKLKKSTTAAEETFVEHIAYNAKAQRVLIAYGNGIMTRHAYDPKTFRLARLRTEEFQKSASGLRWQGMGAATGVSAEIKQDYSYTYDLAGNIVSIEERVKNCGIRNLDPDHLLRLFEYDPIYRLTKATGRASQNPAAAKPYEDPQMSGFHSAGNNPSATPDNGPDLTEGYTEDYQYDPAGNMLALGHSQGSAGWGREFAMAGLSSAQWANATSNRLTTTTVGSDRFVCEYDDNGNMTRQALNHHHTWDHADRMTSYRNQNGGAPSVQASYLCGADGMRVKKWVKRGGSANGEESTTYIGGIFEHHRWQDGGTAKQNNHLHVMDNQSRIAMQRIGPAHHEDAAPEVQYHLGDHLGSSTLVLGGADAIASTFINREEYTPYGETSFGSHGRKRYRFSGKERDEESGLYYFGARFYAPWMARWVSCDPVGRVDGNNLYRFTQANPIRYRDAKGHKTQPASQGAQSPETSPSTTPQATPLNPKDPKFKFKAGSSPTADQVYKASDKIGIKFVLKPEPKDGEGNQGGYRPSTNTIEIYPSTMESADVLKKFIVHELVHAIQRKELIDQQLTEKEIMTFLIEEALSYPSAESYAAEKFKAEIAAETVAIKSEMEYVDPNLSKEQQADLESEELQSYISEHKAAYRTRNEKFYNFWKGVAIKQIEAKTRKDAATNPAVVRPYEDPLI